MITSNTPDFPIDSAEAVAGRYIARGCVVHQKWTCTHCGSRQTMVTPDVFHRHGYCSRCGDISAITHCGYTLFYRRPSYAAAD